MRYTEDELLKLVGEERRRSIGFGEGDTGELVESRERGLRFYQGDVSKDVPALANRSSAVSTDVAEAIETALPDLVEIFIGGDDIATFQATSASDERQAEEESDYVRHVIFAENDGFLTFNTTFKDALTVKTGLFHWWWEEKTTEEVTPWLPADQLGVALVDGGWIAEGSDPDGVEVEAQGDLVRAKRKVLSCKVCVKAVPPEDFTVAPDTVALRDATYCAMRDRPRVQDLIARGVDPVTARDLKSYSQPDTSISQARDEAGEETLRSDLGSGDLRQVEVRSHYIRLLSKEDELEIWRIDTDSEETMLVGEPEKVPSIPFGPLTPYLNPHRFYGGSVADKLIEIQKIKTTLWRMQLDSGYFALNQRTIVDISKASDFTIADLLNNVPNMPIRVNSLDAVRPITAGGLNFDVLSALEQASVMGEQRTGIVRNAQGLKPDTLHDTAKGAMVLISAAQKRLRYIARVFAETGVRDLFLGVHELLRQGYGQEPEEGVTRAKPHVKIRKQWKDVDPSNWPERKALDAGIGSAGREHDMAVMGQIMQTQAEMLGAGLGGTLVKPENIYAAAIRYAEVADVKSPERFFSDPADPGNAPQQPKPDPAAAKAQAELAIEQQKAEASIDLERAKGAAKLDLDTQQAQRDHDLAMARLNAEMAQKRYEFDAEMGLKREQLQAELQMKRELGAINAISPFGPGGPTPADVNVGGDPG